MVRSEERFVLKIPIVVLVDTDRYGAATPEARAAVRAGRRLDLLVSALRRHASDVSLREGHLGDPPAECFLLLDEGGDMERALGRCPAAVRGSVFSRTVLLGGPRAQVTALAERYGLVAALDSERLLAWSGPDRDLGAGLLGLRSVGQALGADAEPAQGPLVGVREPRYARLVLKGRAELTEQLVAYLEGYLEVERPLAFSATEDPAAPPLARRSYEALLQRFAELDSALPQLAAQAGELPPEALQEYEGLRLELERRRALRDAPP